MLQASSLLVSYCASGSFSELVVFSPIMRSKALQTAGFVAVIVGG
jgi:hypothetical protein